MFGGFFVQLSLNPRIFGVIAFSCQAGKALKLPDILVFVEGRKDGRWGSIHPLFSTTAGCV